MSAKIMVIEDEVHIQRLIRLILEKKGYEVFTASNGVDGLKELATRSLDLILLDIIMPGMDGLEVLRRLKADAKLKQIPVVMLTAVAQENVVIEGLKLGVKDFIRKPFHPDELVARLTKIIA